MAAWMDEVEIDGSTKHMPSSSMMNVLGLPLYRCYPTPVLHPAAQVAAAAVIAEQGAAPWLRCAGLVLASILIIAWLNLRCVSVLGACILMMRAQALRLSSGCCSIAEIPPLHSNDAFDAATGVDKSKRESVVNLTGGKKGLVLAIANLFLVAGVGLLSALIISAGTGGTAPAAMLAVAIACGYLYQGPPFRLSYKGLGEPLCFFAFGPLATPAFYLAMMQLQPEPAASSAAAALASVQSIPPLLWALSACVGITTTVILFCSHFHQIEGDLAARKMSPLVRLGERLFSSQKDLSECAAGLLLMIPSMEEPPSVSKLLDEYSLPAC